MKKSNEEIKISICVPVYNVEKYLRECLNSLINQTYKNIEIICVDDGSTDDSLQILKEYSSKDSRIQIIKHEKNKGLFCARKTAVKEAIGEYLLFVDSDDFIEVKTCEHLVRKLKSLFKFFSKQLCICLFNIHS